MQEIYKDIVGYEGLYQVSNLGNVKSLEKYCNSKNRKKRKIFEKILKTTKNNYGYLTSTLFRNSKRTTILNHRLVALAFIPNPDNKPQINHINGIKTDNRVENLEWCTHQENIQHAFNIGLNIGNKGEKNGRCKLTKEQVLAIRADNRFFRDIAKDYNVHYSLIGYIKKNKLWSHL